MNEKNSSAQEKQAAVPPEHNNTAKSQKIIAAAKQSIIVMIGILLLNTAEATDAHNSIHQINATDDLSTFLSIAGIVTALGFLSYLLLQPSDLKQLEWLAKKHPEVIVQWKVSWAWSDKNDDEQYSKWLPAYYAWAEYEKFKAQLVDKHDVCFRLYYKDFKS